MQRGELIAALEAADGPSRELDAQIAMLVLPGKDWLPSPPYEPGVWANPNGSATSCVRYTASVDAALTLVPEGWHVSNLGEHYDWPLRKNGPWWCSIYKPLPRMNDGGSGGCGDPFATCQHAHSAAIALCIAALKAGASHD